MKAVLTGWAKADPAAALDHLDAAPPGGADGYFASDTAAKVLRVAAEKNAEAALAWLEKNGGTLGREAWLGMTPLVQKRLNDDPAAALDFIASRPEAMRDGLKTALDNEILNDSYRHRDAIRAWLKARPEDDKFAMAVRDSLLRATSWQEPALATTWAEEKPEGDEALGRIRENVAGVVGDEKGLEKAEELLSRIPENLREQILVEAFGKALHFSEEDIKPWLARLETLSPEWRPRAVSALVGRMAAADPQRAAEWVSTLPGEEERRQATGSLVTLWAGQDSYEASQWVSGLPPGAERDMASRALAQSIAAVEPDSAWAWAENIAGASQRNIALTSVLDAVRERDPDRARRMVRESSLNAEEQARLMEHLGNSKTP